MADPDDVADYRHLRLEASAEAWAQRLQRVQSDPLRDIMQGTEVWTWWQRMSRRGIFFSPLHKSPAGVDTMPDKRSFWGVNYCYDVPIFQMLQRLAMAGGIGVMHLDLLDKELVRVVDQVVASGLQLGCLRNGGAYVWI